MGGEKTVITIGKNARLFIEDQAFYDLTLQKQEDYIVPVYQANLPSSGFYVQVNFKKFLPHKISTIDKELDQCLVFGPSSSIDDNVGEIMKKVASIGEEEGIPIRVQEKMEELIMAFMAELRRERIYLRGLVPVSICIVATVFSSELEDVFSSWKRKILASHGVC